MRRKFVCSIGLAGLLTAPALGQLPVAPPTPAAPLPVSPGLPAPRPLPEGVRPAGGAYVPPVGGVGTPLPAGVVPAGGSVTPAPQDIEIPSALGPNHPWAVKPETGAFFICVKSYSRPAKPLPGEEGYTARQLAESLAGDIRELYRVQTFLFEYVSEERKAEMAAIAAARAKARIFAGQLEKYRQDAQLKGMIFLEEDRIKIHYKSVNYREQIAVLVGPFKSDEDARKALDTVRKWPAPKNTFLMDGAAIVAGGKNGKPVVQDGFMNPYRTAHVVPNPAIPHTNTAAAEPAFDPLIIKLNEGRPYSMLKATKTWTLGVKSFSAPSQIVSKDTPTEGSGIMKKFGASKGADVLQAGAEQAEAMAKMLREMKGPGGQSLGLEAFVLHTRTSSIVSIGQFDGPNDPALLQLKQLLAGIRLNVTNDKGGTRATPNAPSLLDFESMIPMPIPKMP